jgi:RND superfamily putative drug exporter
MVIAPAVVTLLGDRAWWLPAWLDRALPNISLEGRQAVDGEAELETVQERETVPV